MEIQQISISRSALRRNIRLFRQLSPRSFFLAVVKSNAYGHGLKEVVQAIEDKIDWFGVNSWEEAVCVHELTKGQPILIMGLNGLELYNIQKEKLEPDFLRRIHFVLSDRESMQMLLANKGPLPSFHIKIDSGLSRLGVHPQNLPSLIEYIQKNPSLNCTGVMTHFANVEDVINQEYAKKQLEVFQRACEQIKTALNRPLLCHAAASAAALILPESQLDMIRVGISLYGLWPSSRASLSFLSKNPSQKLPNFLPALRWSSRLVHIHDVKRGEFIGYGCTFRTEQDTRVGVIPVGYFEGYERALSNRNGYVLVHGQRARLLGRVSMNMICIDLSLIKKAKVGDEAVLLGEDKNEKISADDLAELTGTINYEVLTRINSKLPRVLVD